METNPPGYLWLALNAACTAFGDAAALTGGGISLTYRAFAEQAQAVADALRDGGVKAGEPVHVLVSNHPLDLAAIAGVWAAGAVAVPMHRTTPEAVAAKMTARTQARFAVDMRKLPHREGCSEIGIADAAIVPVAGHAAAPAYRLLLQDAALIVFTSGTTGTPKGVVISHAAFHGKIEQIDTLLHFQANEKTLLVLNITFSFGMWMSLLTLLRGGTLVMHDKFDPVTFLRVLADARITRVGLVPTMMRVLFADPGLRAGMDAVEVQGSLQQILIGGEALGRVLSDTIRYQFAATALIDIYGLTETATCDFFAFPADYAVAPGCIGRSAPHVAFRIVDEQGQEVAVETVGELQLRSPYLMNGYLDEPELTAAAFAGDWFKTGDLARVGVDGLVTLAGRSKELISRGGNKVTPGEIEQLLCSLSDVSAAMAVGVPDAVLGERIHVLVVPHAGMPVDFRLLRLLFQEKLEKFKQPDAYYLSTELPVGRTGKADRSRLRSMIQAGEIVAVPLDASR